MNNSKPSVSAKRVVLTSFFVDVIDLIMSFTVMAITGSMVMLAESLQAMSDILATGLTFFGVQRSKKFRDSIHQFGHGRELYIWTLVAAMVIVITSGIPSIIFGVHRLISPSPIHSIWLGVAVQVIAITTNGYAFTQSRKRLVAGEVKRPLFKIFLHTPRVEAKTTFVLDLVGLLAAITGLIALVIYAFTGIRAFDGIGAIIIGLLLIILAVMLFIGIKDFLIGRAANPAVVARIREVINSNRHVNQILDIKTMHMGPDSLMVDTEIYLHDTLKTKQIEQLIEQLTIEIQSKVPQARFIQIEVQTPEAGKIERKLEEPVTDY